MSEIKILEVQTKDGSQREGFEELCVQLFRQGREGDFHRINGAGGDGGVEAYHVDSNGKKTGMQAKFFREMENSQWSQLDKSVKSMLKNHPDTKTYEIFCSLDRTPDKDKRWDNRLKKWKKWAMEAGFATFPEYVWKGESELIDLLTEAENRRLAHYWFGTPQFSLEWLEKNNRSSIDDLERRYLPYY